MKIADIEVAKAVIGHEKVDCFLGKEGPATRQPAKLVSCIGGVFFGRRGEEWPRTASGRPLIPWLQIACTEMKGLYGPFYRREAVCFYIDEEFDNYSAMAQQDQNDFVVREYPIGEKLTRLRRPAGLERHKFHPVTWRETADYPCISKYYDLFEESVYSALCDPKTLEYQNHPGIKIGGWPTPVQLNQRYPGEFDLQIDITNNYMYMDSGIAYLSFRSGTWDVMFDCC